MTVIFPEERQPDKANKPVRVLGIDLGTTNSTVAEIIWNPGEQTPVFARCIEVEQNTLDGQYTHLLIPSVVALYGGKVFVGEGAKRLRSQGPELGLTQNKNLFYECKNDMGILRTYHMAPEGFRSAAEIGGKVLEFLYKGALADDNTAIDRVVVTVPASFQGAQRSDTIRAAEVAGLKLSGGDLLDEPVSAFLDYMLTTKEAFFEEITTPQNVLIFDFGGGTCDVAMFKLRIPQKGKPVKISPLSVSRYHRLGGGDIDKAIVYDILIPQLLEQNKLSKFDLSFEDKKNYIEPELLGLAEALKTGLCTEISRLQSFGKYESADKQGVIKIQPGVYNCKLRERTLTLKSPQLTAAQFENLLKQFLDKDLLYARETEYRMTCSVFAPLQDALDRSNLSPNDIDYCLMVGGSSLILQVVQAVENYFPKARVLSYTDKDSLQVAIARGAAYHALALELFGRGLIQPVCHENISIKTVSGLVELVSKGTELPYPIGDSIRTIYDLAIPETKLQGFLKLRLELVSGDEQNLLYSKTWEIPGPVNKGDPLCLEYRYDQNQIFDLKIKVPSREDVFAAQIENPLTNIVNPQTKKIKIAELEEELRTGKVPKPQIPEKLIELSENYSDVGHKEKAIDFLKRALKAKNEPDAAILNKIGMLYGEIRDFEREEKFYKEAAAASSWSGPLFNLALAQKNRGKYDEAIETLEKTLKKNPEAPYVVLRALLAEAIDNQKDKDKYLEKSLKLFDPLSEQSDWELGWFLTAAHMKGDQGKIDKAKSEQRKRAMKSGIEPDEGILPIQSQGIKPI